MAVGKRHRSCGDGRVRKVGYGGLSRSNMEHEGPVEADVRIEVEFARKLL
jgi:hypothetical protein